MFSTDGCRAFIAEDYTFANLDRVTPAAADFLNTAPPLETNTKIIIGYNRRFTSDHFARRSAENLAGNGFGVVLTSEPTPTPSISYAVKAQRAAGGVMITASHNPPSFNGFKLKADFGGSAEPCMCEAVEKLLDKNSVPAANGSNANIEIKDIRPEHYRAIKKLADFKLIANSHVRFAHDP